jgi:hypothetical protein
LQQQLQNLIEKTDDLEDAPDSLLISPDLQISDFEKLPFNHYKGNSQE